MASLLDIINEVDSFKTSAPFFTLLDHTGNTALGYITEDIARLFESETQSFEVDVERRLIRIRAEFDTLQKRNELFAELASRWRALSQFDALLNKGWRDELYTVYNPTSEAYFYVERAFSVLIGVVSYGVHINGYVPREQSSDQTLKFWVPKRSLTKPTYPGKLDNTVAGGLETGRSVMETAVKECFEEAGLKEDFVNSNIRSAGAVSYMHLTEDGRVQPEVEFVFDLKFSEDSAHLIQPQDGEAEDFKLMTCDEVLAAIRDNKFKPNCALIIVDFLIRHGYVTPANEPSFLEIVSRCHVKMPFPTIS